MPCHAAAEHEVALRAFETTILKSTQSQVLTAIGLLSHSGGMALHQLGHLMDADALMLSYRAAVGNMAPQAAGRQQH